MPKIADVSLVDRISGSLRRFNMQSRVATS